MLWLRGMETKTLGDTLVDERSEAQLHALADTVARSRLKKCTRQ